MFEKNKNPEIRFTGSTDDWKKWKIEDILTVKKCSIELDDTKEYELVTVKRRNEGVVSRGLLKGKNILVKNYFEIEEGDYIISKRQVVHGANGIVPKSLDKAIVSNEYLVVGENENIANEFWAIISKLPNMYHKFFISSYGVDIEKLVFDVEDWKKRTITIPLPSEQKRIIRFFKHLDKLLSLHQQKYNKLTNLKKAMLEKMFPKEGADVPEIRFKGFSAAWVDQNFERTFTNIPNNTLSRAELNYESGLAKNIHYGDVLIKYGELLDIGKDRVPFISSNELVAKLNSSKLQNGDIVLADAAEDQSVGKCTELINLGEEIVYSGLHTIPIRPTLLFASGFLGYFMNSPSYHNQLLRLMQGTKVLSISKSAIKDTSIIYPVDIKEQEKISTYFQFINNLITQHQIQLTKLKNIKKACLEKMFV